MAEIPKEKLLWIYETMVKIREHEERVAELFAQGKIPGFVHLYVGEEAVATGVMAHLRKGDFITSTHRGHGHFIAKGGNIKASMAELFGKATGICKGKGGSMHIADLDVGELGANGIVGGGIPHAVGAALGIKLNGLDNVAVAFFGDGASNQQNFHEAINLAAIWKLPVVFVCENNLYQISLPYSKQQAIKSVAERAAAYGIPGVSVDGQDVFAVYEVAKEAIERARNGEGPTLIEAKTYRFRGHFEGDPQVYRSKEEVEWWKENKDPIVLFEKTVLEKGLLTKEELDVIREKVKKEIEEAIKFAEESPWPKPEEVLEDVFSTPTKGVLVWQW
ncbi:MAG TPA: thiamine pyrophosphate-dependent dehydrogenase E1 component subunit alpha [Thermococcus litoralis]|uniref:Thiamine pyrophosphate-dependent dehydrogenase E1 component subunit alpha n=1 Tax=Thermococcus litoralis TaxID=2265 RepID=A0A7C0TYR2_THELI|nr:MAG: pyruvate dehydrogenase (acetyl-transferring) E1 component subunit alpha [Thermococci archaeon]RLF87915.1 MAG: pyruvate dehydrogenase (acetyl-transferring) E1 component subunit alpha [Thermococci archaeon]HDD31377.1 thiamine pyrophosphate-dependent dehydrogenase E1 component subunit alpha [Thermococcus litoralis]